jgi:hypothetical protein
MQTALTAAGIASDLYIVPYLGHTAAAVDRKAIERSIAFLEDHLAPKHN